MLDLWYFQTGEFLLRHYPQWPNLRLKNCESAKGVIRGPPVYPKPVSHYASHYFIIYYRFIVNVALQLYKLSGKYSKDWEKYQYLSLTLFNMLFPFAINTFIFLTTYSHTLYVVLHNSFLILTFWLIIFLISVKISTHR